MRNQHLRLALANGHTPPLSGSHTKYHMGSVARVPQRLPRIPDAGDAIGWLFAALPTGRRHLGPDFLESKKARRLISDSRLMVVETAPGKALPT